MSTEIQDNPEDKEKLVNGVKVILLMYILGGIGVLTGGLFMLAGLILAYIKKDDLEGTFLASHARYYIRTFWYSLLWAVIGAVTALVLVGYIILLANVIWIIYRMLKGFLSLQENKAMYAD